MEETLKAIQEIQMLHTICISIILGISLCSAIKWIVGK